MKTLPLRLQRDEATVRTYEGEGGFGAILAKAVPVSGRWALTRQLARNADGVEVLSELVGYVSPDAAALFAPGSQVAVFGRTSEVISVSTHARPGHPVFAKVLCS